MYTYVCMYVCMYVGMYVCLICMTWPGSTPVSGLSALSTLSMSCSELVEGSANHWRRLSVAFQASGKIKEKLNMICSITQQSKLEISRLLVDLLQQIP